MLITPEIAIQLWVGLSFSPANPMETVEEKKQKHDLIEKSAKIILQHLGNKVG